MITNKFVGAIAAAAVIAFVAIPVTANAHGHKHTCYCTDSMSKEMMKKHCVDGKMTGKMTEKKCEKMHGTTTQPEATKDEVKK